MSHPQQPPSQTTCQPSIQAHHAAKQPNIHVYKELLDRFLWLNKTDPITTLLQQSTTYPVITIGGDQCTGKSINHTSSIFMNMSMKVILHYISYDYVMLFMPL